jgi:hypothetical protein
LMHAGAWAIVVCVSGGGSVIGPKLKETVL